MQVNGLPDLMLTCDNGGVAQEGNLIIARCKHCPWDGNGARYATLKGAVNRLAEHLLHVHRIRLTVPSEIQL